MDTKSDSNGAATGRRSPVVFVPGLGGIERGTTLLSRHLRRAGFHVAEMNCPPVEADVSRRAEQLARHVEAVCSLTGAHRVHLVGHNVGGTVARYYVQLLDGDRRASTVVTVGTAHAGTTLTQVGLGPASVQLRPGSAILRHLEESTRPLPVRFLSYFSERDLFVRPVTSAVIRHPLMTATNVLVTGHGHLSVIVPPVVSRSVAHELAAEEGDGAPIRSLRGSVVRLGDDGVSGHEPVDGLDGTIAAHLSSASRAARRLRVLEPTGV